MNLLLKVIRLINIPVKVFIVFLIVSSGSVFASSIKKSNQIPVRVSVNVDKRSVTIGDKIRYTLAAKVPRNIEIKFPQFADNLGGFAIRDFGSTVNNWWFFRIYKEWYVIDTYASGNYTIPATVIKYRKKRSGKWRNIDINAVKVNVKSVLNSARGAYDIKGIYPPVYFPGGNKIFIIIFLIVLIIVLGGAWMIIFARKKRIEENTFKMTAYEIAYKDLNDLKSKNYISKGLFEIYFTELSDIVRHYLENRFDLRAPEMTTEEFLNTLKRDKLLSYEHKNFLRDFLSHCDLVKFARYESDINEAELGYQAAKNLVDRTQEEPRHEQKVFDNK